MEGMMERIRWMAKQVKEERRVYNISMTYSGPYIVVICGWYPPLTSFLT